MNQSVNLYTIAFTVGAESGLALVAANNERDAFQILQNGGSRCHGHYKLTQIRCLGISSSCTYGLLMESFVNAMEAYNAIISVANRYLRGEDVWVNMYIDDEFYLHLVEDKYTIAPHLSFNESTGYLTIT